MFNSEGLISTRKLRIELKKLVSKEYFRKYNPSKAVDEVKLKDIAKTIKNITLS